MVLQVRREHGPLAVWAGAEDAPLQQRGVRPVLQLERELPDECLSDADEAVAQHPGGAVRTTVDEQAEGDAAPAQMPPAIEGGAACTTVRVQGERVGDEHGGVADEAEAHRRVGKRAPLAAARKRAPRFVRRNARVLHERTRPQRREFSRDGEGATRDKAVEKGRVAPPEVDATIERSRADGAPLHRDGVRPRGDGQHDFAAQPTRAVDHRGGARRRGGVAVRDAINDEARRDEVRCGEEGADALPRGAARVRGRPQRAANARGHDVERERKAHA
mgnify:CR=1 FL=1